MTKKEFLQQLENELATLKKEEREKILDYYGEMICDAVESGKSEEEIIAAFGAPHDIAVQILSEEGAGEKQEGQANAGGTSAAGNTGAFNGFVQPPLPKDENTYCAKNEVTSVVLFARHTAVEVRPVSGKNVRVHFVANANDHVSLSEENGVFSFQHEVEFSLFHWRSLFSGPRRIILEVPADFNGDLNVTTCNAHLRAENFSALKNTSFNTSNARLSLNNIFCEALSTHTSNGKIDFHNINGKTCRAETCNGRIELENCTFSDSLNLETSNSPLCVNRIKSDKIDVKTSNGSINGEIIGDMREYSIHSHTSNGSSSLPTEMEFPGQTKSLTAKTSNGKINLKFVNV